MAHTELDLRERLATVDSLPEVFGDSLPDGWGRLLIDREFERRGSGRTAIAPVDRLAIVGTHGMGALIYRPEERTVGPNSVDLNGSPILRRVWPRTRRSRTFARPARRPA
jgi:hypothetical protein